MVRAGVVDANGNAKYTGLHPYRHFYASWLINRKADGGLELPIKTVQQRLGHSSIVMTSDTTPMAICSRAPMTVVKWQMRGAD